MAAIRRELRFCHRCDEKHGRSEIHADERYLSNIAAKCDDGRDDGPTESDEADDKLKVVLASVFALQPEDLVLLQHLYNGGNAATFADAMRVFTRGASRKHSRQWASFAIRRFEARHPSLAGFVRATRWAHAERPESYAQGASYAQG